MINGMKGNLKSANIPQPKFSMPSCSSIFSVRWINSWEVECFCRKSNCRSYMRFLDSRNSYRRLYIILSRILAILGSNDIGQ